MTLTADQEAQLDRVARERSFHARVDAFLDFLLHLVAFALVLFLMTLFGCRPAPAARADLWPASTPAAVDPSPTYWWCVAGASDEGESVLACADSYDTCSEERAQALKWGELAHIAKVGECDHVTVEPY